MEEKASFTYVLEKESQWRSTPCYILRNDH